jgi:hypothetical protein
MMDDGNNRLDQPSVPDDKRLTLRERRELLDSLGVPRTPRATRATIKARERAQRWRDDRDDACIPDNRLLAHSAWEFVLRVDAEKRLAEKPAMDTLFSAIIHSLPRRFEKDATRALIENYRKDALGKLVDRE